MQLASEGEGVKVIYNPEDTNYPANTRIKDFQGMCSVAVFMCGMGSSINNGVSCQFIYLRKRRRRISH